MDQSPLLVLIVENDQDSARMLRLLLKRSGYETRVERDGPAALLAFKDFRPRVILLDQTLVGMSGIDVAYELRSTPEFRGCVLISVSGLGEESLPSPSPFDGHFSKPIEHDALLEFLASTTV